MSDQGYILSLARQAEVYRAQGLFEDAREKYLQVLQFINKNQGSSNHKKLKEAVKKRIRRLEKDITTANEESTIPTLSQKQQDLIKTLFSFSHTKEASRLQGAIALAKFGQYERALEEFHTLLGEGILPVVAAKNILRCHMELSSPDEAVAQFKEWVSGDLLSHQELKLLKTFLNNLLVKNGIRADLPPLIEASSGNKKALEIDDGFLDISTVNVQLEKGPLKGDMVEFEVTSQSGNTISVNIPAEQKDLVDAFKPGLRLPELQCYSPIAVFKGRGLVIRKRKVWHGRGGGNFLLDITIDGE